VDETDRGLIQQYEQATRELLRSFVALYSSEVTRYEKLLKRTTQQRDDLIRTAYAWQVEPKELQELSGVSRSKLFSDILNSNAYPDLKRQRQADPENTEDRAMTARFNNIRRTATKLTEDEDERDTVPHLR
jgi:hypothetical protein